MITRDFSVISMTSHASLSLSLSLLLLLTKVTHAQYRKRFRASEGSIIKNRKNIGSEMKTLEAKPFDQNVENWKREHRLFTSTVVEAGKIESERTHSEVIEQFDSFSLLKLLFLVRNWHCWSRKAFPRQMTPKADKKLRKRPFFDSADRHEKLYGRSRLYARHWYNMLFILAYYAFHYAVYLLKLC